MRHVKKLHGFMMRHLRSIMKIKWQHKMTNITVLKWAGITSREESPLDRTSFEDAN